MAGGQGVSSEVWVRGGGGSVPISVMRYPAVGRKSPDQVVTDGWRAGKPWWVLTLLSLLIVSCGASPQPGYGLSVSLRREREHVREW